MNHISEEINQVLHEKGNISISEITNYYELPADFIHQVIYYFLFIFFQYFEIKFRLFGNV